MGTYSSFRSLGKRQVATLATGQNLDARHHHLRTRPQIGQVRIGVVLAQQPDRQIAELLRHGPQRITAPHDVDLGTRDAMLHEEFALELGVIVAPHLLEGLARDA